MASQLCVGLEAADGAYLGEQLRGRESTATREFEQRRRELRGPLFELLVKRGDRAVEGAALRDKLTREPHLQLLVLPAKPTADPLQMGGAGEHAQRHLEGRIKLMQMPAQPLMHPSTLVDDRVAMVDQQLQLSKRLLVAAWPSEPRLAQRSASDCERINRVGLPSPPTAAPLRRHQLRRHPHQRFATREQLPLQPARQPPTVFKRPQAHHL